ncbi:MAG: hypothetical protein A2854_03385 [Parcubacteria group bacterium RIFCSPHIGHO2_01_FULL_56_18]|nr:MAG: hypothetical protein A2854_03385 [Parcubacteria group bacterium RIFCSPHIGHO2_01_FULL_56_18]
MWFQIFAPGILIGAICYLYTEVGGPKSLIVTIATIFLGAASAVTQALAVDFFSGHQMLFVLQVVVIGSIAEIMTFAGMIGARVVLESVRRE